MCIYKLLQRSFKNAAYHIRKKKKNFDRQYLAMCIITIVTAASIYIYITMSCTFIVPVVARIIVIARYFNNITYTYEGTSCMFLCL